RRHTRWPRDWSSDVCSSDLSGQVGVDGFSLVPPDGVAQDGKTTGSFFGLSSVSGPAGGLVGVFLGPDVPMQGEALPTLLNFTAGAREVPVVYPVLRQVFYIGRGRTSGDALKSFVVPHGASRLLLGVLDSAGCNAANSG